MAIDVVAPTEPGSTALKLSGNELDILVSQAREADEADRRLTIKEALKQNKSAVFWAMILSTSLIMEGFDLVTVSRDVTPWDLRYFVRRHNASFH